MKDYILAIDIGTTSTKVVAFSKTGELLHRANAGYPILHPKPTHQEQAPDAIYQALMKASKEVIASCERTPIAIVFSSAMHSLIAVDKEGELLTNSIIWADGRSQDYADALRNTELGKDIYERTGTPIHPMSLLCKIAWLRDHESAIFERTAYFISIKAYVLYRWFGRFVIDESIASATGLFDVHERKWYEAALDYCDITSDQLAEVVSTKYVLEDLKQSVAEELQIPQDTPIIIGASDGCLANLGAGITEIGKAVMSIGTSAAIRMTHHTPIPDVDTQLFNYILDEKHYVIGGPSNNGGVVYEWFQETFGTIEAAADLPIGSARLLFLPYLMGERAPVWNTDASAAFIGLRKLHNTSHLLHAALEGIILNLYQIAQSLEQTETKIEEIYASGGFTKNETAMQILADVFNAKVYLQTHQEGTALGAAILGFQALGITVNAVLPEKASFSPNASAHQQYQALFEIWSNLYGQLKESFAALRDF